MKTYNLKKLVLRSMVDPTYRDLKLVAVPDSVVKDGAIIRFNNSFMMIEPHTEPLTYRTFPDKFGRDKNYTLCYYKWKEQQQETLL